MHKDGSGFTAVPGWDQIPWHTMVMAAAGAAGENRDRVMFDAGLNGGKSLKWTDAWWVHKLAPVAAKERGLSTVEVIRQVRAEADRLVASRSGEWSWTKSLLARDGRFGDVE